jgi:signal transduction histidine kinase
MTRRLVVASLLLATFVLLVVELPLGLTYAGRQQDRLLADIERDARVLAGLIEEELEAGDAAAVEPTVAGYAEQTGGRIVVTDDAGVSVVDTDRPTEPPRDFSTRPEIAAALDGSQRSGIRRSETLGEELAYVAVPVTSGPQVTGAVRISFLTDELREQVRENWARLALLSVLVLAASAGFGWLVARWAVAPVDDLDAAAEQLADGDLGVRVDPDHGPPELRRLSSTFNGMAGRLESLVGSQRAFVADASHQLRTPLTALRLRLDGIAELLGSGDAAGARGELEVVERELDRLGQLVEGLLALARSEAAAPALTTVDAAAVTRDAELRWGDLAAEAGLRLEVHADGPAPARVVAGGLEQVLDNLLDNAFEVAPRGSAIVLAVLDGTPVHVTVRDHGPGLGAESRHRATDRFWRAPDAPSGGTGLGLAIVSELVRSSGGEVELCEPGDDGGGLLVDVRLPRG